MAVIGEPLADVMAEEAERSGTVKAARRGELTVVEVVAANGAAAEAALVVEGAIESEGEEGLERDTRNEASGAREVDGEEGSERDVGGDEVEEVDDGEGGSARGTAIAAAVADVVDVVEGLVTLERSRPW